MIGASGYIGSALVDKLLDYKCTIIRASRDTKRLQRVKKSESNVIDITINNNVDILPDVLSKVDVIYYLSSQTSLYVAEKDVMLDLQYSVEPVLKTFSLLKDLNNKPIFIFSSAATICGLVDNLPIDEESFDNPITIYDIHKLLIEKYIKFYIETGVIDGAILRLANVYGQGVKSSNQDRGVLNFMINNALNSKDLPLYGDGEYVRDYVYIDDVIGALLKVVANIDKTNKEHYYIGSGAGTTIKNTFYLIKNAAKDMYSINIEIENVDIPSGLSSIETRNFCSNSTKFKSATNWTARVSLDEGIRRTMKFYKES